MAKFNEEMKKFIVKAFGRNNSPTKVRLEFLHHYEIENGRKRSEFKLYDFIRVNQQFEKAGSVLKTPQKRSRTKRSAENLEKLQELLNGEESFSVRKAALKISVSPTTFWKMLRYDSKAKFYRQSAVQPLTEAHMEQRRQFCTWILEQPDNFAQRIIWTDEKFFVLHQRPNRKNDGKWAQRNPHEIVETNDRNDKKIMMFVAIVDGRIPVVHAFIDENGRSVSVNGSCYLQLLQDTVWPALRSTATRKSYWWMQDGAPPHCTNDVKEFLLNKFQNRVISRGTSIIWPAHSPDLNPLDFHFWGEAQRKVCYQHPEDINSLIEFVKDFAAGYDKTTLRRVAQNVLKRARLCLSANGGHFQHLLK